MSDWNNEKGNTTDQRGRPLPAGHFQDGGQIWLGSAFPESWRNQMAERNGRAREESGSNPTDKPAIPDGPAFPEEARGLFTAAEFRILARFFGRCPEYRQLGGDLEQVQDNGACKSLDGAVARIVLERIQHRLPNWMVKDRSGDWVETRSIARSRTERKVLLRPIFVGAREGFGAGPGCSWFCHYHATWVPLFDRFVVTESGHDGEDRAMGHFDAARGFDNEALHEIVDADWISDDEWVQGPLFGLKG